jgi:succinylarginine dihydrolase
VPVNVRQSMANGGGPACLRLRVVADPATVDPRFLVDQARLDMIEAVVSDWWPANIEPDALGNPALWSHVRTARAELLKALDLSVLE